MLHSPNRVEIDLSALDHNVSLVREIVGPGRDIIGIVKSDAYGHGLIPVSERLVQSRVAYLGVAHIQEAMALREASIGLPIIILCGILSREDVRTVVREDLIPVISDFHVAEMLAGESQRAGKKTSIHLKVDTGMGRLGIPPGEARIFMKKVLAFQSLRLVGLVSHFPSADEPERVFTEQQIRVFRNLVETGRSMGLELAATNLANSAGIMAFEGSHFHLARPGIMLYGGLPSPGFRSSVGLKPVMHFKGTILQIREFPAGTPISYGRTYCTGDRETIAVLSAGYGDGIPRSLSNNGRVLIRGRRVPIVGRVCMNMIMVNISDLEEVAVGEEAVFLGTQGDAVITGDDMASWADSISYEIYCSIGQRHQREYIG